MRPRLQVFKTKDRGWGVRCLDDLPKGTFVAHYSGIILTDKDADEVCMRLNVHYVCMYLYGCSIVYS